MQRAGACTGETLRADDCTGEVPRSAPRDDIDVGCSTSAGASSTPVSSAVVDDAVGVALVALQVPLLAAFLLLISSSNFSRFSFKSPLISSRMLPGRAGGEVDGELLPSGEALEASGVGVASRDPR